MLFKFGSLPILCLGLLLLLGTACNNDDISKLPEAQRIGISSGTLDGIPFTVLSGYLEQSIADGPVTGYADGGILIFDPSLTALIGSTDPEYLMQISLDNEGSIVALAFGNPGNLFANGLGVGLTRPGGHLEREILVWIRGWATLIPDLLTQSRSSRSGLSRRPVLERL